MNFAFISGFIEIAALIVEGVLIIADSRLMNRIKAMRAGLDPKLQPHSGDSQATVKALHYDRWIVFISWVAVAAWLVLLFIGYDGLSMMVLIMVLALNWDADWRLQRALVAQKKARLS